MAISTYLNIGTSFEMIERMCELKIEQRINEHASLYLKAIIQEEYRDEYIKETNAGEQVLIAAAENGEPVTLFKGIIRHVKVYTERNIHYLEVFGLSNSFKTDIKINSRSFQNKEMTYKQVLDKVMETYKNGQVHDTVSLNRPIENFTMQYRETDWEFIKRLASHYNVGLVPALEFEEPKMTFGIPNGDDLGELERYNYSVEKDLGAYMISRTNFNPALTELDQVQFNIETEENFKIGDTVTYKDISLTIKSKTIEMINGILIFQYALSLKNGLTQNLLYNEKIVGLSLKGSVLKPVQDRIKVHLEIDEEQEEETAWEFPYTTPYTAEGNTGWYVMPEVEDIVFINFPDKEEFNGVGLNAIRLREKDSDKINDPSTKYFRTKHGKELKFSPDEILITCSNWSNEETGEENIIYIRLNESNGIEIQSTKPIKIHSDDNININSGKEIVISAEEEIKLNCKTSQIQLTDAVDVAGKIVKIN